MYKLNHKIKIANSKATCGNVYKNAYKNSDENSHRALPKKILLPLFLTRVSAGFISPAEDYIDKELDLNEYIIKNRVATFFLKVQGDSMINAGIHSGDMLVIDRSLKVRPGKIIVAIINGEFTVKRLLSKNSKLYLKPENINYPVIEVTEEMEFEVWGVVTNVIHKV